MGLERLLLLLSALRGVHGQANCILTFTNSQPSDFRQSCDTGSAINVIGVNEDIVNIYGGGGELFVLEGQQAVDVDEIQSIIDANPRASIFALAVENNRRGVINIFPNDRGPNRECRDNTQTGAVLVTVGLTTNQAEFRAYANFGVLIVSLYQGIGGTVNQRGIINVDGTPVPTVTPFPSLSPSDSPKPTKSPTNAFGGFRELQERLKQIQVVDNGRRLQDEECQTNRFDSVCWWLKQFGDAGRTEGIQTCRRVYNCGANPCVPPPCSGNDCEEPTPADDDLIDDPCLAYVVSRCNCGLFVRGDPCYWKKAKRFCLNTRTMGKMKTNKDKKKSARLRIRIKEDYWNWCKDKVEEGKFPSDDSRGMMTMNGGVGSGNSKGSGKGGRR